MRDSVSAFRPHCTTVGHSAAELRAVRNTNGGVPPGTPGSTSSFDVLGITVNSAGQILFNNSSNSTNYLIADVDNQIFSNAGTILASNSNANFPSALAVANGSVWASGGSLRKLDNNGQTIATFPSIFVSAGMWTNPVTGHLIAISGGNLLDIDVSGATPVATIIRSGVAADGVTVSPDGAKAYLGINGNNIVDLIGAAHALSSFGSVTGIDGMGVITSSNALNGSIIVNTTVGNIVLVNPTTLAQTILASGGGYGDFTGADPTNGTLLLSSSNSIVRLSCGAGCGIGSAPPPSGVPEPSTTGLLAISLASLGALRLRRN